MADYTVCKEVVECTNFLGCSITLYNMEVSDLTAQGVSYFHYLNSSIHVLAGWMVIVIESQLSVAGQYFIASPSFIHVYGILFSHINPSEVMNKFVGSEFSSESDD